MNWVSLSLTSSRGSFPESLGVYFIVEVEVEVEVEDDARFFNNQLRRES